MITLLLLSILIILQILDYLTTVTIINNGGREVWPPMVWLMKQLGTVPALIIAKGLYITLISTVSYYLTDNFYWNLSLLFFISIYSLVVIKNYDHI